MADKEKYVIKVEGKLVEVTPDVYYAYFRMERQERGQEEKKQRNEVVSYDVLEELKKEGISERTIHQTKKQLDIRSIKREGAWYWLLPESGKE